MTTTRGAKTQVTGRWTMEKAMVSTLVRDGERILKILEMMMRAAQTQVTGSMIMLVMVFISGINVRRLTQTALEIRLR